MGDKTTVTHGWKKIDENVWVYTDQQFGETRIECRTHHGTGCPTISIDNWVFTTNTLQEVAQALLVLRSKIINDELQ